MGYDYEALEVEQTTYGADWILSWNRNGRFPISLVDFVPDLWFVCYLLYIIFIWFSSGTRNCISSNLYLLVLEHNISATSTYYRSQFSGVNLTLAFAALVYTSQTGLLNYIYSYLVSMPGEVKDPTYQSALEICTLPWTGSTPETPRLSMNLMKTSSDEGV